jgi:hypothetical protein
LITLFPRRALIFRPGRGQLSSRPVVSDSPELLRSTDLGSGTEVEYFISTSEDQSQNKQETFKMDYSHEPSRVSIASFSNFDIVYNTEACEIQSMFRGDAHFHIDESPATINTQKPSKN